MQPAQAEDQVVGGHLPGEFVRWMTQERLYSAMPFTMTGLGNEAAQKFPMPQRTKLPPMGEGMGGSDGTTWNEDDVTPALTSAGTWNSDWFALALTSAAAEPPPNIMAQGEEAI